MKASGVTAKVCGLNDAEGVLAAIEGGARFVGFVFYPPSPRSVTPLKCETTVIATAAIGQPGWSFF